MATSIGYTPPSAHAATDQARDEVDDLVRALHESGLLRALAGGARSYPRLLKMVLDAVEADTLRSVVALGAGVQDLDPEGAERLASGVRRARTDAAAAAAAPPEGVRALLRRLRDPDTRRGLAAALAALAALGAALGRPEASSDA